MVPVYNNQKQNILIYAGNLAKNGITTALFNLLKNVDTQKYNYYITFNSSSVKNYKETLLNLPDNVRYISMLGMMKANPLINWGIWFVLLSIYINRSRTRSYLTQSGISLIMVTFSTLFLYYRLTKGLVAK